MFRDVTSRAVGCLAVAVVLTLTAGRVDAGWPGLGYEGVGGWVGPIWGFPGYWPEYSYACDDHGCLHGVYVFVHPAPAAGHASAAPTTPMSTAVATKAIGHIRVRLPSADAVVWANGVRMGEAGRERDFDTPPLPSGKSYSYEVRIRWTEPAGVREQTRIVRVRPQDTTVADFTTAAPTEATVPVSIER
jgi:uncharacterized protein (TIGR03000 family)